MTHRMINSRRAAWEDAVNAAFDRVGSAERVCAHADCTVTNWFVSCDYCPAEIPLRTGSNPVPPAPFYYSFDQGESAVRDS